jgi:hypothetical protein
METIRTRVIENLNSYIIIDSKTLKNIIIDFLLNNHIKDLEDSIIKFENISFDNNDCICTVYRKESQQWIDLQFDNMLIKDV